MKRLGYILLIATLSDRPFARALFAQAASQDRSAPTVQPSGAQSAGSGADTTAQASSGGDEQMQYAPALDGAELIAMGLKTMDGTWKAHMFLGAMVSGGWDSNPNELSNTSSTGVFTLSPYFGAKANTSKTQYLFQYQPTITKYSSNSYPGQTLHVASTNIVGHVNERWSWDFQAIAKHGADSSRLLGPQQTVAVGGVPGTGPNSASYLPNAGTVTYIDGGLGIHYRRSERNSFVASLTNTFNNYSGLGQESSIATAGLTYDRGLSPTLGMAIYGRSTNYYGSTKCASFGGGVGIRWQSGEKTSLSLSAGPQFDTSACGSQQGFSYTASFSTSLTGRSQLYLLAARQPATSYLGPGLWQTSASGGFQRRVATKDAIGFDVGYVGSNTLTAIGSYHGAYVGGVYSHPIGYGLSASLSYRWHLSDADGSRINRNIALFSLSWAPPARMPIVGHLFQ